MLSNQILKIIDRSICDSRNTYVNFLRRLREGALTRDENSKTHFCAYFLPYNQEDKKVFIVYHKKAELWLSPGGHIDKGEKLLDTLNREIYEELGMKNFFKDLPSPFLLTITPIENKVQSCKAHFDIWYLMETDGNEFNIDLREFKDTGWMTIDKARQIVTDPPNRRALDFLKRKAKY